MDEGQVTQGGVGSAAHHMVPTPSQSLGCVFRLRCSVQASEMAKALWNNCSIEDFGLRGVE